MEQRREASSGNVVLWNNCRLSVKCAAGQSEAEPCAVDIRSGGVPQHQEIRCVPVEEEEECAEDRTVISGETLQTWIKRWLLVLN